MRTGHKPHAADRVAARSFSPRIRPSATTVIALLALTLSVYNTYTEHFVVERRITIACQSWADTRAIADTAYCSVVIVNAGQRPLTIMSARGYVMSPRHGYPPDSAVATSRMPLFDPLFPRVLEPHGVLPLALRVLITEDDVRQFQHTTFRDSSGWNMRLGVAIRVLDDRGRGRAIWSAPWYLDWGPHGSGGYFDEREALKEVRF